MSDQADACQRALRYPNITPHDQATLLQQVDIIRNLEIRRAEEETAQAQAKESERQQLIAEKAKIDEELQQKQLELQRLATTGLALQKAAEEQHKKDVQQDAAAELERRSQVAALFNACWAGDPVACDAAEQLPLTPMERSDLIGIRQSLIGSGAPPP